MALKRLRLSHQHKENISKAKKGKTVFSDEHRAKLSEAQRKRVRTPEELAKIKAAAIEREARKRSAETVALEGYVYARRRWKFMHNHRINRWKQDKFNALKCGSQDVFQDVKQSGGWQYKRKLRMVPGVSDGCTGADLREAYKQSKHYNPRNYGLSRSVLKGRE